MQTLTRFCDLIMVIWPHLCEIWRGLGDEGVSAVLFKDLLAWCSDML